MKRCKICGREFPDDEISHRGICVRCGFKRMRESIKQLQEKRGEIYERWLKRWKEGVRRKLEEL